MKQIFSACLVLFFTTGCQAQSSFDKKEIVSDVANILNQFYVFPEVAQSMTGFISSQYEKGNYEAITSPSEFATRLQADLRSISHDKHIRVVFDPERVSAMRQGEGGFNNRNNGATSNYGFEEIKILEGNIGYLDLRNFYPIGQAKKVAKETMDKLIQSDAIVFDLRQNGGGSPEMIQFISSYLFGDKPVHLNTFYWRPTDSYTETWTTPKAASANRPDVPVYVLTSSYTFSAAEEFTYNLKHMKRATIVGETTGGGAHPGGPSIINDSFFVNVPRGRAINPITKTNWEGVGVVPHVQIESSKALEYVVDLVKANKD